MFYDPTEEAFSTNSLLQLRNLILLFAIFTALIALPTSLTLGLFVHIAFQQRGVTAAGAYILAGALGGAFVPVILTLFIPGSSMFVLYGVPAGIITGLFAWLIRRPDRDAPNPTTAAP